MTTDEKYAQLNKKMQLIREKLAAATDQTEIAALEKMSAAVQNELKMIEDNDPVRRAEREQAANEAAKKREKEKKERASKTRTIIICILATLAMVGYGIALLASPGIALAIMFVFIIVAVVAATFSQFR